MGSTVRNMTPIASFRHIFRAVLVALLAAFVLSACGSVVDATKTEKDLKAEIPGLTETDLKVTSVTCPEDEDFKKGASFDCDYTVEDDTSGVAHVDVTSAKGDGEVEFTIARYASGQMAQYHDRHHRSVRSARISGVPRRRSKMGRSARSRMRKATPARFPWPST